MFHPYLGMYFSIMHCKDKIGLNLVAPYNLAHLTLYYHRYTSEYAEVYKSVGWRLVLVRPL
jgi:hypothetical protein